MENPSINTCSQRLGKTFRKNASKWRSRKKEKSICIFSNLFRNIKASKSILIVPMKPRERLKSLSCLTIKSFQRKMSKTTSIYRMIAPDSREMKS